MARIASRLSRKELAFIAQDIGPELVPFLNLEDVVKGMSAKKRQRLIALLDAEELSRAIDAQQQKLRSQLLATMSVEDLVNNISPTQRKRLFALVLKQLADDLIDEAESGRNGND